MNSSSRTTLGIAKTSALLGFLVAGALAAKEIAGLDHVREFQAGEASGWGERVFAIAQRAAVEGLGFGLIGLVGGLLALLLAGRGDAANAERDSQPRRIVASFLLVLGVFAAWMKIGAWFVNEAVPFLPPSELFALNLAGMAAALIGLVVFRGLAAHLPGAPRGKALALSVASLLAVGLAALIALRIFAAESGGWRQTGRQVLAGVGFLVALPVAAVLAKLLAGPVDALASRVESLRVPRVLSLGLLAGLALSTLVTRPFLQLSPQKASSEYAALAPSTGAPASTPNVVFVTIDTLRADHLGCYGYDRPTSPAIDAIAAAGTRFDDPIAAAAWTKPATGTLLTGLYPSRHGALYHGSSLNVPDDPDDPNDGRTLAEAFQDAGYVTAGFVSNPNVKRVFDFDRGFDEYFDSPVEDTLGLASIRNSYFGEVVKLLSNYQFNWKYDNDVKQMNSEVFAWLESNHEQPFFLYVHYIDPHEPYSPPPEWRPKFEQDHGMPLFNERKRKVGIDLYDAEIAYNDEGIQALVDELRRHGVWDDTVFLLTSDHGEEFFEHEVLGHGFSLYQEVVRVPLIVRGPGIAAGRVVTSPVQTVDLAATLLDAVGLGVTEFGDGKSFAASMLDPGWAYDGMFHVENEFGENDDDIRSFVLNSVRSGPWKLVITERNKYRPPTDPRYPPFELYNLDDDPHEQHNLFHTQPTIAQELVQRLQLHGTFLNEHGLRHLKPKELTPELEAELRALGYL